jgi:S1-C subfamily serine protease
MIGHHERGHRVTEGVRRPEGSEPQTGNLGSWRPKPGYVAILAGAAVLILVVGALLKPDKLAEESPVALNETTQLLALTRRSELRDQADFLSGRVSAVTPHLVYLKDRRSSGVAWGAPDSVLTSGGGSAPILLVRRPGDTTLVPALRASADRLARRGWVLAAARQADGSVVSAVGMSGGQTLLRCGDRTYRELVLATPLDSAFKGGALFDLEGDLIGIVGRCGERYVALAAADVQRALTEARAPEARLLQSHGVGAVALDEPAQRYFASDSGVLVAQVTRRSTADAAGLRPGDIIVAVDTVPVRAPEELAALLPPDLGTGRTLTLIRDGRPSRAKMTAPSPPPAPALGLELARPDEGLPLIGIEPGSRGERAGLRAGDRILRIGPLQPRTTAQARQALQRTDRQPVYLVYLRDGSERGVMLP